MKMPHMHPVGQALGLDHGGQLDTQRLVEAQDQDGLAGGGAGLGQVLGAVAQDHGLARSGHAVDHAVAVAQAAGQLLLLQVHHPHDAGQFGVGIAVVEEGALGLHPHLGEHDPAHPVELRQRDGAFALVVVVAEGVRVHGPQPLLKSFGIDAFDHLVLADHQVRRNGLLQARRLELLAGDVGEHHAMAPRERQLALERAAAFDQLRVALQCVDHLDGAVPRLLQRAHDDLGLAVGDDLETLARGAADGVQAPVLHLQHQGAAARVQHHEIRPRLLGADGHVPPEQVVVFQLLLQPLGQPPFAGGHAPGTAADGGNQGCHAWMPLLRNASICSMPLLLRLLLPRRNP